ncbi:MAG: Inward rectifier potassium channel Irk [Saprospiraceae bacterium]
MSKIEPENQIKFKIREDSGFGSAYRGSNSRVFRNDGEFNIERIGTTEVSVFHELLRMSWSKMIFLILIFYVVANFVFALSYFFVGPENLSGMQPGSDWYCFLQCYFFSVQSFTTVGYGGLFPKSLLSSTIAGLEALCGLLTFAIITGLVYTKFSKPNFRFNYSQNLLITPYKDIKGAMFRVVNAHKQKLMDVEAAMIFSYFPIGSTTRAFRTLDLEIKKIFLFPLAWTINHPINDQSPLFGFSEQDFIDTRAEMIVLLSAYDEESGRIIKNQSSYHFSNFEYESKFGPMVEIIDGKTILYLDRVSNLIKNELNL